VIDLHSWSTPNGRKINIMMDRRLGEAEHWARRMAAPESANLRAWFRRVGSRGAVLNGANIGENAFARSQRGRLAAAAEA